jgi:hypothetical protein
MGKVFTAWAVGAAAALTSCSIVFVDHIRPEAGTDREATARARYGRERVVPRERGVCTYLTTFARKLHSRNLLRRPREAVRLR